jgi:hypothetical protein
MSPTPPEHLQPYSDAVALTADDREVRVFQANEGGRVEYAVRDDRFADGWRPVMDADEIAQLVASINARPADPEVVDAADLPEGLAERVDTVTADDPDLVEVDLDADGEDSG